MYMELQEIRKSAILVEAIGKALMEHEDQNLQGIGQLLIKYNKRANEALDRIERHYEKLLNKKSA